MTQRLVPKTKVSTLSLLATALLSACNAAAEHTEAAPRGASSEVSAAIPSSHEQPGSADVPANVQSSAKPKEAPPHVAALIRSLPAHLQPTYDPNSPAGLEWIRVASSKVGDDRWLVRLHDSEQQAEVQMKRSRRSAERSDAEQRIVGDQLSESSEELVLIPVSGDQPRRFRLRTGKVTLEGDAKPVLFDELEKSVEPDDFWPEKGLDIDAPGVALKVVDLGPDKLHTVVLLRGYMGLLIRDTERLLKSLPAVVGHARPDHAERIKQQLETVGATVELLQ